MITKPLFGIASVIAVFIMMTSSLFAGTWNTNAENVVLDGYDVVAYRTTDKPVKGSAKYAAKYDGAEFRFSSPENLAAFKKDPKHYAPKYNGFCAFAVGAKNAKVPANPDAFKLYNGELLVFFNDLYEGKKFNTKMPWNDNERALYSKAETNWKTLNKAQ